MPGSTQRTLLKLALTFVFLFLITLITNHARTNVITPAAGQWTQTAGPYGAQIQSLLVNESDLYAGTNNGVFRSTNAGQSWAAANSGITGVTITALALRGNTLLAATFQRGVLRSTDKGQSWTQASGIAANTSVPSVIVSGDKFFATADSRVLLSTDDGLSWTAVSNSTLTSSPNYLAASGSDLYAGTFSRGVFLSQDEGQNWTQVSKGLTSLDSALNIISLAASGNTVVASVLYGGIFRSTDKGANWSPVYNPLYLGVVPATATSLTISGNNVFAAADLGVFLSTNNGQSWTTVNDTPAAALAVGGSNLFVATFKGVAVSADNGRTLTPSNNGLINTRIQALVASANNLFAASYNSVFLSTNQGESWSMVSDSLPVTIEFLALNGTTLFAGASFGGLSNVGLFRSTDNGRTWSPANNGLTNQLPSSLVTLGNTLFVGTKTGGGVFRSTNDGQSWSATNNGLTNTTISSLAVSGNNLFASTGAGVFVSTNNGQSWSPAGNGLPNGTAGRLLTNGSDIFALVGINGIFRSSDNGQNWKPTGSGLGTRSVLSLTASGKHLFAGTYSDGVFLLPDGGQEWLPINKGLSSNTGIYSLVVQGGSVFAGTGNAGVFRGSDFVSSAATVSAASYGAKALAVESIATVFGANLATSTQVATSLPLPTTLAGASVRVRDSAGVERGAPLFFVSPGQINYLIPAGTATGAATATITTSNGGVSISPLQVALVAPGLFAANANGQGVAAAVVVRIKANGSQVFEAASRFDAAQNSFVPVPIDLGAAGDQVFLVLYGTGVRYRSSLSAVTVIVGGLPAQVAYAGPQADFTGLDQINVRLPGELAGRGEVLINVTVDGAAANPVAGSIR